MNFFLPMTIKPTLKVKLYFLISLSYSLLILYLSLANLSKVDIVKFSSSDKVYHVICYMIMSILWAFFVFTKVKSFKNSYRLTLTTSIIAFGIIIEYLQLYLTDYRSFDWWDVLANSVGVFLGITAFSLFIKRIYR